MRKYNIKLKSLLRAVPTYLLLLFASGLLMQSCIRDDGPGPVDEASVLFTIRMPQLSQPETPLTRAQTAEEMHISNLRILVFLQNGSGFQFSYQVSGTEVSSAAGQSFQARLNSTATPMKIIVAANAEAALASYYVAPGTPEADVREQLQASFTIAGLTGDLPMYGEVTLSGGLSADDNVPPIEITALRAIARVDVTKNLDADSDAFELDEVYVFRANNSIRLIPDSVADPAAPVVAAPSIPGNAAFLGGSVSKFSSGGDEITEIYIPESLAAATTGDRRTGTTVIVVGGRYDNSSTVTYYRADFDPDGSGTEFGQVLRNHHYVFNITKVTAPGWDTPENAANNFSSSIVMGIKVWEDFVSDIIIGGGRFAVSSRSIDLRFVKDREKRLDVESTLDYSIQWLDANDAPTGGIASEPGETIGNANFDVTIVKEVSDPAMVSHLLFRTLNNNHQGNVITERLRVTVGEWYLDIDVRQDNTAIYSNRHFNVLSGYHEAILFISSAAGYLGTTTTLPYNDGATWLGGIAMRMILNERFAPDGVIRIGGFAFDQANDATTHFGVTAATGTDYETMERLIRMQNVIYLSYNTRTSAQMAALVLRWLEEDPRRVLFLGLDSSDTNTNVRSQLTGIGTWAYTINTGDFSRAAVSDGTDDFFEGPFGQVAASATFTRHDTIVGYLASPPASITRLINHANGMVFGVDRERRIIFHGDANLFLTTQLSNDDGAVASDLDRLMANTWAWVVEQLIYGDD